MQRSLQRLGAVSSCYGRRGTSDQKMEVFFLYLTGGLDACMFNIYIYIWPIYNDLSRGHPKWWFSKGTPPKMALN